MMTRRASRPQTGPSGITLTEILISIMILAIGLVSLATLFPIGLLRLREAQRSSRTAILSESTGADVLGRGLLNKTTFIDPTVSPWYSNPNVTTSYDPWIQDTPGAFGDWTGGGDPTKIGAYRGYGGMGAKGPNQSTVNSLAAVSGPGLPVVYDPLWWYQQGTQPYSSMGGMVEIRSRFGSSADLGLTSMDGLQRLTNSWVYNADGSLHSAYAQNAVLSTFVSPEDILWQDAKNTSYLDFFNPGLALASTSTITNPSPVIPDLTTAALTRIDAVTASGGTAGVPASYAAPTNDWRYTWMFTGQRASAFNDKVFTGNVVIFENRPFGFETLVNAVTGATITQVAGERVFRAIFGYGTSAPLQAGTMGGNPVGYAVGADNSVLLLWPAGYQDPEIRSGGWIADVTYERSQALGLSRFQFAPVGKEGPPPAQRCYWYQVRRASPPADSAEFPGWRYTLIQTTQKLQAKTVLDATGAPVHVNAALVSPHVIGVIPKTFSIP